MPVALVVGMKTTIASLFLAFTAASGTARAVVGVETALSVAASVGGERNDTVRDGNGTPSRGDGELIGLTGLLSVGPVAFGATGELSSSTNGIAQHTFGGLAGARLPIGPRLRLLVLGELGMRTFSDAADFLWETTVTPAQTSLPHVGGRIGVTWLALSHLDVGVMAFARTNIGTSEVVLYQPGGFLGGEPTTTTQHLGGFSGGVALQIGFRLHTTAPLHGPVQRMVPKT